MTNRNQDASASAGRAGTALRFAGACALASAVTTFLLWWLPRQYPAPDSFEATIALAGNPLYLARLWVNFAHLFLAMAAYAGFAWLAARRSPVLAWAGLALFALWAIAEILAVSLNLWAQNAAWRAPFATSDDETQAMIRTALFMFRGLWDGLFFVVLTGFLLGSLCFGLAAAAGRDRTDWLERVVGALLLLAVPLTAIILLDGYFGFSLGHWIEWSYPVLQPVSRALMGLWILQQARAYPLRRPPAAAANPR